jgi:hypothetical protein
MSTDGTVYPCSLASFFSSSKATGFSKLASLGTNLSVKIGPVFAFIRCGGTFATF